jgi:hypothetical protein
VSGTEPAGSSHDGHLPSYSVPAGSIDVVWDALRITVHCVGKTFVRQTSGSDGKFISHDDDPVIVTLTDEKRSMLEAD